MKKLLSIILTVLALITIGSFSLLASAAGVEGMAVYKDEAFGSQLT